MNSEEKTTIFFIKTLKMKRYTLHSTKLYRFSANMEALRWFATKGKVELVSTDKKDNVQKNNVIIKAMYSGVCGSDLLLIAKKMDAKDGVIPGHEITGKVEKIGSKVQNINSGDNVVVMPQNYCRKCRFCLRGQVMCVENECVGLDGGRAECCELPAFQVYKLPESLDLKHSLLCQWWVSR